MDVGRRLAVRLLLLLGLTLGLALTPPGAGANPPRAGAAKAEWTVVSPRPGARVKTHPVKIVVRAREGIFDLQARLNGHSISREFGRSRKGLRRARVSASHGLRHGRNVLRVKTKRRNGKWRRTTVTFFITHRLPMAGAGRDRRIMAGERIRLRGLTRRPPGRGRSSRPISYHWKLLKAPRKSRFRKRVGKSIVSPPQTGILGRLADTSDGPTPPFTPDVPGPYTFGLTVGDGQESSSDDVTLSALPQGPGPLVPIDTMARDSDGTPAIKVGNDPLYRAGVGTAQTPPWFQVLVLDRATLGFISNKTYLCDDRNQAHICDPTQMHTDLAKLPDTDLVIAVNHGLASWRPPGFLLFERIGVTRHLPGDLTNTGVGTFSAIGVPGLPEGEADAKFVPGGQPGSGRMTGYLTQDQYFNYTWLPPERPQFDTRVASGCSDFHGSEACDNTMSLGGQQFTSGQNGGGYQVEVFDGHTLAHVGGVTTFTPDNSTGEVDRMRDFIADVTPGNLVVVVSLRNDEGPLVGGADNGAVNRLVDAVKSVGGTADTFLRSAGATGANSNYSLVGWAGAGEGKGEETSPLKGPGDARIRGTLVRDHDQLFKPTDTSVSDQPPTTLLKLLTQPATPWPLDDSPAAQAAIKWIGSQPGDSGDLKTKVGPNVRSAYWLQNTFKKADWISLQGQVSKLNYPGDTVSQCGKDAGFCSSDFDAAQKEIVKEMGWVGNVRDYMATLGTPFLSDGALTSWDDLQAKVTDPIKGALNPPKSEALAIGTEIAQAVITVASGFGGPAGEVLGEALNLSIGFVTQGADGSDLGEIQASADDLGSQIKERLKTTAASFSQMADIIVGDHAKLMTVATNERCSPANDDCPREWQFTNRDQTQATTAIWKATEASFTKGIMRVAFPSWYLGKRGIPGQSGPQEGRTDPRSNYTCGAFSLDVLADEIYDGFGVLLGGRPAGYDVYALANMDNITLTVRRPNTPPGSVTHRMFGGIGTSLDPKQGGVGVYAPDYFREANKDVGDFQNPLRSDKKGYPDSCAWH
jgi:hypothetical protein